MASSGPLTPGGGLLVSSHPSPTSTTKGSSDNTPQQTPSNPRPLSSISNTSDKHIQNSGETKKQQQKEQKTSPPPQEQQVKKFPSRLMALLMRPHSPPGTIGKPVRASPVPMKPSLADPTPPPAAPSPAEAQDPAPTPPMSVFLHSSYSSLRASAEAHLRINSAYVPALPLDTGTFNTLLNEMPKSNWAPASHEPQQQAFSGTDKTLAPISEEVPAKRRCTESRQPPAAPQTMEGGPALSPASSTDSTNSLTPDLRRKRFLRTRQALEKSGLLGITMQTADLINENKALDNEIEQLKRDTELLLRSVLQQQQLQQSQGYMLAKYANVFMNGN